MHALYMHGVAALSTPARAIKDYGWMPNTPMSLKEEPCRMVAARRDMERSTTEYPSLTLYATVNSTMRDTVVLILSLGDEGMHLQKYNGPWRACKPSRVQCNY
jgi:hypothetical protein